MKEVILAQELISTDLKQLENGIIFLKSSILNNRFFWLIRYNQFPKMDQLAEENNHGNDWELKCKF